MQTNQTPSTAQNKAVITINAVEYNTEDLRKATLGAVAFKPDVSTLVDEGDALVLSGYDKTAVFKTEGRLKIVAKGDSHTGYVLINKHSLKKTHAQYIRTPQHFERPEQRHEGMPYGRHRMNIRPNTSR